MRFRQIAHLRKRLIGDLCAVVLTEVRGWRYQQSRGWNEDCVSTFFFNVYYVCWSTLGHAKHYKKSILEPLLYSFSCTHNHNEEREALQWTTADHRTYWDFISDCCSWMAREEQWLHNALTINHPERPVWYGHSLQECRGDGLMSAQHGRSYQQIAPQQGGQEALPTASTQEPVFAPKNMIYEWNQSVFT